MVITYNVGYFVGSLASDSINQKLAGALVRLAPSNLEFAEIPIKDLPLYSRDYDDDFPPEARSHSRRRSPRPMPCSSSPPSTTTAVFPGA